MFCRLFCLSNIDFKIINLKKLETIKLWLLFLFFMFFDIKICTQDTVFDYIEKNDFKGIKNSLKSIKNGDKIKNDKKRGSIEKGETIINAVCVKNSFELLKVVIESLPKNRVKEFVNEVGSDGQTPLACACFKNNLKIVKYLLEKGAKDSVNVVDGSNFSPLYWACCHGNIDMAQCLIDNNAEIDDYCFKVCKNKELLGMIRAIADEVGFIRRPKSLIKKKNCII